MNHDKLPEAPNGSNSDSKPNLTVPVSSIHEESHVATDALAQPESNSHAFEGVAPARPQKKANGSFRSITIGVGVLAMILAIGIIPRIGKAQKLHADVETTKSEVPTVTVVRLKGGSASSSFSLPCNIQAAEQTTLNPRTSGYLKSLLVDIGSVVRRGQVLASIESPEVDQQFSQSQAEFAKTQAGLAVASADVDKQQAAIAGSQADVGRVESALMQAKADVVHLQAKELQSRASVRVAHAKVIEAQRRLDGSRSDLVRANAGLSIAKKTLDRWRQLEKAQAVSGQEVDEKESDYETRAAQVESAKAAVSSAEAIVQESQEAELAARSDVQSATAEVESGKEKVHASEAALNSSKSGVRATMAGYSASKSTVNAARATVDSALANSRRVEALKSFENIVAPFSGVITARNVDIGDLVNPSSGSSVASDQSNAVSKSGLFGLARTDVLRARINVPEMYVGEIHEGQIAKLTTQEYPTRVFTGSVWHISGALDSLSRTLLVDVRISNENALLKPGMSGQIQITLAKHKQGLRIPAIALIVNDKGSRVQVVDQTGAVHYVTVTLGRDFGDEVEILDGLAGNESIVTNPDETLVEGSRVAPVTAKA